MEYLGVSNHPRLAAPLAPDEQGYPDGTGCTVSLTVRPSVVYTMNDASGYRSGRCGDAPEPTARVPAAGVPVSREYGSWDMPWT